MALSFSPSLTPSKRHILPFSCALQSPPRNKDSFAVRDISRRKGKISFCCEGTAFSPPPIDGDLHDAMSANGAVFSEDNFPLSFGNDSEAVRATVESSAVFDMSHFGRMRFTGEDRLRFLHNQSTADFLSLSSGQGCDTVFVTSLGRTVDLASAWIMSTSVIVTVSPQSTSALLAMFDRYIFPADKVAVQDVTGDTSHLALIGPTSDELVSSLGLGQLVGKQKGTHAHFSFEGSPFTAVVGSGLAEPGYQLLLSPDTAGSVWSALVERGVVPMGTHAWEVARVMQGRPAVGHELTADHSPMEAGLWHTLSLSKGCYLGQEVIAKQINYDGVRQELHGLKLQGAAAIGSPIFADGKKVGKLTSYCKFEEQHLGLGYVKKAADSGAGLLLDVDGVPTQIVHVPFLTRSLP